MFLNDFWYKAHVFRRALGGGAANYKGRVTFRKDTKQVSLAPTKSHTHLGVYVRTK